MSPPQPQPQPPLQPRKRRPLPLALLVATRPRQWVKNLLVFAAPVAAGVVGRASPVLHTLLAALLFSAAASGVYLLNDAMDVQQDRLHPVKRLRPIAAGEVSPQLAKVAGALLLAAAVVVSGLTTGAALAAIIATYAVVSVAYSLRLKQVPVVELLCVASGFLLRTMAGGVAAHVPLSPWFLVFVSSGALLVAIGKRTAEQMELGANGGGHRPVLAVYSPSMLMIARLASAAVTVGTYFLWALYRTGAVDSGHEGPYLLLSVIPFLVLILVLERAIEAGRGGAPEELLFRDHLMQAVALALVVLAVLGLYS